MNNERVKNVIITGGTRGLGLEFSKFLASKGYNILLTDISEKACEVYDEVLNLEFLLKELRSYGVTVDFYASDLTNELSAKEMFDYFLKKHGEIDAVVANAGGDISGCDENAGGGKASDNSIKIEFEEHENIFKRNYYTCLNTIRACEDYFRNRGFGKIITLSSVNSSFGVEKETSYAVAKAAVLHLTRCVSAELRSSGVNVNCMMLGPTKTGRFLSTLKGRNPHDLKALEGTGRLTRVGNPEDVSPVLGFLLSDASDFISGQVIRVDGGLFTQPV
jgi:3-oxoacyl-[acyl-carrier protein] reductase